MKVLLSVNTILSYHGIIFLSLEILFLKSNKPRVAIVGGGPAGLIAAGKAAYSGADVILVEKGHSIARKLLITGKGRCNLTNTASINDFVTAFGKNGKFLYSAFSRFFRDDLLELLANEGVRCKEERGGRIFPESDRSQDVLSAIQNWVIKSGVKIKTGCKAISIIVDNGSVAGIKVTGGEIRADAVVIATGGLSYPKTGSTGDGYKISRLLGHTVVDLQPALAPLLTSEKWAKELMGLSLKNVTARLISVDKDQKEHVVAEEFGEMLFTHFGVSGPIILTLSRQVPDLLKNGSTVLSIDLKPALSDEQLHTRIIKDSKQTVRLHNYLKSLLPNLLAKVFPVLLNIDPDKPVHRITIEERKKIVGLLKDMRLTVAAMGPVEEAIVTAGGIAINEVDSKTMMSKIVQGLFFAGEVLDIDAKTGGYNLQAAFSTGFTAGMSAAEYVMGKMAIE